MSMVPRVAELLARTERRPAVVGIDGVGGAGKSTLAGRLVAGIPHAGLLSGDDFYREMPDGERAGLRPEEGYQRYFDWQRLRREVLVPAREGRRELVYRRYDWPAGRLGGVVRRPMPEVLVVEGVYTLRPDLADLLDVTVWVSVGQPARQRRLLERGQDSAEWIRRWAAAEDHYTETVRPWLAADLVVSGE
jgi:uridine kinase